MSTFEHAVERAKEGCTDLLNECQCECTASDQLPAMRLLNTPESDWNQDCSDYLLNAGGPAECERRALLLRQLMMLAVEEHAHGGTSEETAQAVTRLLRENLEQYAAEIN